MSDTIKFTSEELQSIAKLQADYQQQLLSLGQLDLEKVEAEQYLENIKVQHGKLLDKWKETQKEEQQLLNTLSQKYGDGVLNLKDGTFKPTSSGQSTSQ